eukprot:gnl/MRDRNA2_/MRDRNA2_125711_c0_seq1.p1 gnl/MRDRNA2_/MRDRNA2_125711_c0~~gnl/MRDRNA2_/MRDRNA2_125711_c0_seq1.p1  ORF type:complete len:441 (+),score=68.35 gnl/MRDRNA2_/MRDRNA2_125711_c0_seq1:100-1422(+)
MVVETSRPESAWPEDGASPEDAREAFSTLQCTVAASADPGGAAANTAKLVSIAVGEWVRGRYQNADVEPATPSLNSLPDSQRRALRTLVAFIASEQDYCDLVGRVAKLLSHGAKEAIMLKHAPGALGNGKACAAIKAAATPQKGQVSMARTEVVPNSAGSGSRSKARAKAASGYPRSAPDKAMASSKLKSNADDAIPRLSPGTSAPAPPGFAEECLRRHNELRALHGAPPLQWSPACAMNAKLAAQECVRSGKLFHSNTEGFGQNGFQAAVRYDGAGRHVQEMGGCHVTDAWYAEIKDYDFVHPRESGCGHFTQLIWVGTTHMGAAVTPEGFVFANYWPAGNIRGKFSKNVLPRGAPMQAQRVMMDTPIKLRSKTMTVELQQVLDSLSDISPQHIKNPVLENISRGLEVEIDYVPPPPEGWVKVILYREDGTREFINASF